MLRLFKSKLFILALVTITVLVIIGISSRPGSAVNTVGNALGTPLNPFQKAVAFLESKVGGIFTYFEDMKQLKKENDELRAKLDELERDSRDLNRLREENKMLRETLNLKDQFSDYESIGGNIIAKDVGNWFNIFTIDSGTKDGVVIDSPVITSKGLVGSVYQTGPLSSKVISIIDVESAVSAMVSNYIVIVRGDITLKDQGLLRMDRIPVELDLKVGDTVETSGVGGIFPKGILIGKVKEIRQGSTELSRYAVVEPAVDFRRLREVFVLVDKTKNIETGNEER